MFATNVMQIIIFLMVNVKSHVQRITLKPNLTAFNVKLDLMDLEACVLIVLNTAKLVLVQKLLIVKHASMVLL